MAAKNSFRAKKSLGQNFLVDQSAADAIVDAVDPKPGDLVIEIGPGKGVLTEKILDRGAYVVAIELDQRLIPILENRFLGRDNLIVLHQDILKTNLRRVIEDVASLGNDFSKVKVVGNLPYYITTAIINKILVEEIPVESITVMTQREVADRIQASPGGRTYGILSIAVQYFARVIHVTHVPRQSFRPVPNVDSTVIKLEVREKRDVKVSDEGLFFALVKRGFGSRRKTLVNNLNGFQDISKAEYTDILEELGIGGLSRAETLSIADFAELSNRIRKK